MKSSHHAAETPAFLYPVRILVKIRSAATVDPPFCMTIKAASNAISIGRIGPFFGLLPGVGWLESTSQHGQGGASSPAWCRTRTMKYTSSSMGLKWVACPEPELHALAQALETAYQRTLAHFPTNAAVRIDPVNGRDTLTLTGLDTLDEPPRVLHCARLSSRASPESISLRCSLKFTRARGLPMPSPISVKEPHGSGTCPSVCAGCCSPKPVISPRVPSRRRHRSGEPGDRPPRRG